jgi:methyltransferase (TIGR00027 family)
MEATLCCTPAPAAARPHQPLTRDEEVETLLNDPRLWEADRATRYDLDTFNRACHDAVPVLHATRWQVTNVERGFAETVLPLNVASTNQFVTHQAALMLVAADYTGGIALSTLFHRIPILGFHALSTDVAAYMWGARSSIKWILPSTRDLVCRASVEPSDWARIYRRFLEGKKVLETVRIEMFNGDTKVAEADFTYWVADARVLRRSVCDDQRAHPLAGHRLRSSAHLIAGLRAMEGEKPSADQLFSDPYAAAAAEVQGITLAKRFCARTPEVQSMVAARTRHLDDLVQQFEERRTPYQAVNIGAGLDFRRWRLRMPNCARYIELDVPPVLAEKRRLLALTSCSRDGYEQFALDLLDQSVGATLERHGGLDPSLPTLVWWEGGSMYFTRCAEILRSLTPVLRHPHSRLWFDYVTRDLLTAETIPRAAAFIDAMQKMGEPFLHGFLDVAAEIASLGLEVVEDVESHPSREGVDGIFRLYRFCVARHSG